MVNFGANHISNKHLLQKEIMMKHLEKMTKTKKKNGLQLLSLEIYHSFQNQKKTGTSAPKEKTETSNATAEKMRKMREESNAELCPVCSKQVFQAEKLVVEEKNKKKTYHKACFKCSEADCGIQLDLRTFGTYEDKAYCLVHSKEKNKSNTRRSTYVGTATTFIPEVKEDAKQSKGETPQHIADKFKSFGSQEKCKKCQKSVMATEKLIVEQLKEQHIYHKACLKCSVCDIQLTITSCGSSGGVIYCKTHLKSHGGPKMSNDPGIFVSPLASKNPAFEGQQQRDQQGSSERDEDESPKKQHNEPEQQEEEPERRDESPQKQRDPSPEKERDPSPERQRDPSPQKQRDPSPERQTHVDDEDDEKEKRRIEREKRKKEREDEALKEEEERRQRQEERKKRMQAIKEEEN